MLSNIKKGTEFYYADRDKKEPVKCIIQDVKYSCPCTIYAQREDTGKVFTCYDGFGCYDLEQYNEALKDAQKQEDRKIY